MIGPAEQTTLASAVYAEGVGLHSGMLARIALRPAGPGDGIVFRRTDLHDGAGARLRGADAAVPARPECVAETRRGVTLQSAAGVSVMTVEHLLAALSLAGVDNVCIDVFGPEIPILDGSAAPFLELIEKAGIVGLARPRAPLIVERAVRIEDGARFIAIEPCDRRIVDVEIDFADAAIGRQRVTIDLDDAASALGRIGPARTFCTLRDVDAMRAGGLALGGSLDNAVVVDGDRLVNEGGLRDPMEFALHKALDLVGDLSLVGAPVYGRVRACRSGHDLNTRLARALAEGEAGQCEAALAPARLSA